MTSTDELVRTAHEQFELLDWFAGNPVHTLYFRELLQSPDVYSEHRSPQDFIARLCTLFGPPRHVRYALRDRETDLVIFATIESGPGYTLPGFDANAASRDPVVLARIAADPVLAQERPVLPLSSADGTLQRAQEYDRHEADARAPVGIPAVARRLAGLVEAAPPTDWELHHLDHFNNVVEHTGFRDGYPFRVDLPHDEGLIILLDRAESAAAADDHAWNHALDALGFARGLESKPPQELQQRLLDVWREAVSMSLDSGDGIIASGRGWLRRCGEELGLTDEDLAILDEAENR